MSKHMEASKATKRYFRVPSKRSDMLDSEYTRQCLDRASGYGLSVPFWIRDNDPKKAAKLARLSARWGNILLDNESSKRNFGTVAWIGSPAGSK